MTRPTEDRERSMIDKPDHWPHRPKLPLMRRLGDGSLADCGYLVEGHGLTVFIGNILLPPTGMTELYADLDGLLARWRID